MNLDKKYKDELIKIARSTFGDNFKLIAYGSRVNGNSHDGSDLDLAISSAENILYKMADFKEKLSLSNIPFLIDIIWLEKSPDYIQKEVEPKGIVIL